MRTLHAFLVVAAIILTATASSDSGDKKTDAIAFEVYARGYFVKNKAPLPGNPAYLVLHDKKAFDQIFGFGAVMGAKPKLVDAALFESKAIVAVVKSGSTLWKYEMKEVTRAKNRLVVKYTAIGKDSATAKFNSALIVAVPRGDYTEVVFVENGVSAKPVEIGNSRKGTKKPQ